MPKITFSPLSAEFPSSNFPELKKDAQGRHVLAFDATTNESCWWTFNCPAYTGTPEIIVSYYMASATSGDVDVDAEIEAISDGDEIDMDGADSFDTANSTDGTTVPGTQGYPDQVTITLTNRDSMAEDDICRFRLTKDATNDTASGDMHVVTAHLKYT